MTALKKPTPNALDTLRTMTPGDVAEVGGLMPGLGSEAVVLQATEADEMCVIFRISYFGVYLCTRTLTFSDQGDYAWI